MRRSAFIGILIGFAAGGCASSGDSERDWTSIPPMDTTAVARKATFETRTDTVTAEHAQPTGELHADTSGRASVRFTVQIGSFADAKRASAVQASARHRFTHTVVNDYNAQRKLYQIRVGFFDTEDEANTLCAKLRSEFPKEYKDAWVAQITK